jgi:DNA-binding transcriptional MerR regulator
MIRRGQAVGFGLVEMTRLIKRKAQTGQFPLEIANDLIRIKREKLREDMKRLAALDQQLVDLHEEINRTFG